jgi:hypothetical protein
VLLLNLLPTTVHRCTAAPYTLPQLLSVSWQEMSLFGDFINHHGKSSVTRIRCWYVKQEVNGRFGSLCFEWRMPGEKAGTTPSIGLCELTCATRTDVVACVLCK